MTLAVARAKKAKGHDRDRCREQVGEEHPHRLHDGALPGRLTRSQVDGSCDLEPGFRMLADDAGNRLRLRVAETGGDETVVEGLVLLARVRLVACPLLSDPNE